MSEDLSEMTENQSKHQSDMDDVMGIAPEYDLGKDFKNGSEFVGVNGFEGLIDHRGEPVDQLCETEDEYSDDFSYEDDPSLQRPEIRTRYGYINRQGNYVIAPEFQQADPFKNGLARVKIDNKTGIIDRTGAYVIEPHYDEIDRIDSRDRIFRVRKDMQYGLIDIDGRVVAEPQFENVGAFSDGCAPVQVGEKWGCINTSGTVFIEPLYDTIHAFSDDRAAVKLNNKWGFVDRNGFQVIKPTFDQVTRFHNSVAAVCLGGKWGLIDISGKIVLDHSFDIICDISNSDQFLIIRLGEKHGIINNQGKTIVEPVYDDISFSDEGVFIVGVKEDSEPEGFKFLPVETVWEYGLIDLNGQVILPPTYAYSDNHRGIDRMEFHQGLAAVCVNHKWGYINARGEMVIDPKFESAKNFSHGVAYIQQNGLYGLIDKRGNIIVEPQYINISSEIKNGYIRVENKDHRWGVIDTTGRTVVPPRYEYAFGDCSEGMVIIQQGEKFGYADCRTDNIILPVYNYVWDFSEGLGTVRRCE